MLSWLSEIATDGALVSGLEWVLGNPIYASMSCIHWKDNLLSLCTGPQGPPRRGRLSWCLSTGRLVFWETIWLLHVWWSPALCVCYILSPTARKGL